jgi:hypothetical protein
MLPSHIEFMKKRHQEHLPAGNPLAGTPKKCAKPERPGAKRCAVDSRDPALESTVESFAWDTVLRVRRLAELCKRYPAQAENVARQLLAWPVMSTMPFLEAGEDFRNASYVFELGRDYPLDTSSRARIHSGSVMGRYLTQWIKRLHEFRLSIRFRPQEVPGQAKPDEETIRRCWGSEHEPEPGPKIVAVLRVALTLPALTKATSREWSQRALVPLIMLSDAGSDETTCREPALQAIWRQKGVKSAGTFRSRLLSTVCQMVRKRARPA